MYWMVGCPPGGSAGTSFCSGTEISISRLAILPDMATLPVGHSILVLERPLARFRGKTTGVALPDDPRMLQHIHPVRVWQREGDVLLSQQYRDRRGLSKPLRRF